MQCTTVPVASAETLCITVASSHRKWFTPEIMLSRREGHPYQGEEEQPNWWVWSCE